MKLYTSNSHFKDCFKHIRAGVYGVEGKLEQGIMMRQRKIRKENIKQKNEREEPIMKIYHA